MDVQIAETSQQENVTLNHPEHADLAAQHVNLSHVTSGCGRPLDHVKGCIDANTYAKRTQP